MSPEAWAAVGLIGAGAVTAWSTAVVALINKSATKRSAPINLVAEQVQDSLGFKNGRGTAIQMLERIDIRLERLEATQGAIVNQNAHDHSAMRDRIEVLAGQVSNHNHK